MTTPSTTGPHLGLEAKLQAALSGVQQQLPQTFTIPLNGVVTTQAQLAAQLASYQAVFQKVLDDKTAFTQAVQARKNIDTAARDYLVQLKAALIVFLGRGSPLLAKFGMSDRKAPPLTAQGSALKAAKAKLTREKRGTLGRRQKLKIVTLGTPQVSIGATGSQVTPSVGEVAQNAAATPTAPPVAPVTQQSPQASALPTPPAAPAKS